MITFRSAAVAIVVSASACSMPTIADTVDLGDNFAPPDVSLDADFYYCEIEPNVVTKYSCAEGSSGDGGGCHTQKSALRLIPVPSQARCQEGKLIGSPPIEAETNLERVRASVGVDAESSPFYRRPLGLDSHPRVIFDEDSEAAALIRTWLSGAQP